ncbi:hypothetical protein AYO47_03875 [Planctomyces sp. SCGC AG-212-M04]|nr:hypothetical protein AYO47_03875 [Planctomyces sp. SCGC AG-212-M04]
MLLAGETSLNGYSIPESAFAGKEAELYTSANVFLDHGDGLSRGTRELAGVVTNVRKKEGRPRADILVADTSAGQELKKLYAFTRKAEAAGVKVKNLGLSHVARYEMAADRKSVKAVTAVESVDVVIRPATTKGFHEQAGEFADLKTQVESLKSELETVKSELSGLKARQPGPTSSERKEEGNKPFDPAKALENISFS